MECSANSTNHKQTAPSRLKQSSTKQQQYPKNTKQTGRQKNSNSNDKVQDRTKLEVLSKAMKFSRIFATDQFLRWAIFLWVYSDALQGPGQNCWGR